MAENRFMCLNHRSSWVHLPENKSRCRLSSNSRPRRSPIIIVTVSDYVNILNNQQTRGTDYTYGVQAWNTSKALYKVTVIRVILEAATIEE